MASLPWSHRATTATPAQIAFPACVPAAISVGSTDLDDDLASFGNRGAGLDLLAPGADEASLGVAVDPMDIPGNTVGTWSGTSFSAPHVAGAFTLMAQEYPNASVAQSTWFLQAAGVPVVEGGRTYRRLLLRPAPEVLLGQVLFPGEAPVGARPRRSATSTATVAPMSSPTPRGRAPIGSPTADPRGPS